MKFRKITISNFRQFRGTQVITFSEDRTKNVNVIIGDNGLGKTTLLQSFRWCLYNDLNLENNQIIYNLDEFQKLAEGEIFQTYVEIVVDKDGDTYTVKRTREFQKRGSRAICLTPSDSKPIVLIKTESGIQIGGKEEDIDKLIPQDLASYFFFDGERMKHLSENNELGKNDVSIAVKGIFGLNIYEKLFSYLESLEKQYAAKLSLSGKMASTMIDTQDQITKYENNLKIIEKQNRDYEEKIDKYEKDIRKINEILAESKVVNELHSTRVLLENSENQLKENLKKQQRSILDDYIKNAPSLKISTFIDKIREKISRYSGSSEVTIEGVSGHAVDQIINRGVCICGECVIEGDAHYKQLKELRRFLPPESLGTLLKKTENQFNQIDAQKSEIVEQIESKINGYFRSLDEIDKTRTKLDDVTAKLKLASQSATDIKKFEENRTNYKKFSDELRSKIGENTIKNKIFSKNLADAINKRFEISKLENSNAHNLDVIYTIRSSREILLAKFNEIESTVRKELQEKVQDLMNQMLEAKRTVTIDKSYRFTVKDVFGGTVMGEGYKVVTSFSYIGGILAIAKQMHLIKTDTYPLVMDAPYANLDYTNRKTVNSIIPMIAEQMILFTTDSQWSGAVEDGLMNRVGKTYRLVHNVDENKKLKDGDTRILEVTHDFHK